MNIHKICGPTNCQENKHSNFHNKDGQNNPLKFFNLEDLPITDNDYRSCLLMSGIFIWGGGCPEALSFQRNTPFEGKIVLGVGVKKSSVSLVINRGFFLVLSLPIT